MIPPQVAAHLGAWAERVAARGEFEDGSQEVILTSVH